MGVPLAMVDPLLKVVGLDEAAAGRRAVVSLPPVAVRSP
jgi:hypothetical protein